MGTEPEVLGVTPVADGVELALRIPPDLEFLPDHFPRFAMVPGVAQLDWAIRYARAHLGFTGPFLAVVALKFQHPLLPNARVTLRLCRDRDDLAFAYRTGDRPCSGGRVRFGNSSGHNSSGQSSLIGK